MVVVALLGVVAIVVLVAVVMRRNGYTLGSIFRRKPTGTARYIVLSPEDDEDDIIFNRS